MTRIWKGLVMLSLLTNIVLIGSVVALYHSYSRMLTAGTETLQTINSAALAATTSLTESTEAARQAIAASHATAQQNLLTVTERAEAAMAASAERADAAVRQAVTVLTQIQTRDALDNLRVAVPPLLFGPGARE